MLLLYYMLDLGAYSELTGSLVPHYFPTVSGLAGSEFEVGSGGVEKELSLRSS